MTTLLNRGSNSRRPRSAQLDEMHFTNRRRRREVRAAYRATHRHHGWACPYCKQSQILEYATQFSVSTLRDGVVVSTRIETPRWMASGVIEVRCAAVIRDEETGQITERCEGLVRLGLTEEAGFAHQAEWQVWTKRKWAYEEKCDKSEARLDGWFADPKNWDQGYGLPLPRFDIPPPPFAVYSSTADITPVERLEAPRSPMHTVVLWLPEGRYLNVPVTTDYASGDRAAEGRRQFVDLTIQLAAIFRSEVRADVLSLITDPAERARRDKDNTPIHLKAPYGTMPWCWQGTLARKTPSSSVEEEPVAGDVTVPSTVSAEEEADLFDGEVDLLAEHLADTPDPTPPRTHAEAVEDALARVTAEAAAEGITFRADAIDGLVDDDTDEVPRDPDEPIYDPDDFSDLLDDGEE